MSRGEGPRPTRAQVAGAETPPRPRAEASRRNLRAQATRPSDWSPPNSTRKTTRGALIGATRPSPGHHEQRDRQRGPTGIHPYRQIRLRKPAAATLSASTRSRHIEPSLSLGRRVTRQQRRTDETLGSPAPREPGEVLTPRTTTKAFEGKRSNPPMPPPWKEQHLTSSGPRRRKHAARPTTQSRKSKRARGRGARRGTRLHREPVAGKGQNSPYPGREEVKRGPACNPLTSARTGKALKQNKGTAHKRAGQQGARLGTSSPHATGNRKETATQLHRSQRAHRNKRGARKKSTYFRN
ncbi:hypothetical protein NDU88_002789 [Pleurodeles waltl]|uniref:Uncharacterized protein n=1 Tax=Pleurodeles waltl TaxID=8319 RepID=A0AAV7VDH3_PLEWA|nr:hypothetical protein NDU88_002789 [Pleurodeles waltl]